MQQSRQAVCGGTTASVKQRLCLGGGKLSTGQWLEEIAYQDWNVLDSVRKDTGFYYIMWILDSGY